jgi:hypothetical protein
MNAQLQQDQQYIALIRTWATYSIHAANVGNVANAEWNNLYGGASRLVPTSFIGNDDGLTKEQIGLAKDVLYQLNAWLDSDSRRAALMAIVLPNISVT